MGRRVIKECGQCDGLRSDKSVSLDSVRKTEGGSEERKSARGVTRGLGVSARETLPNSVCCCKKRLDDAMLNQLNDFDKKLHSTPSLSFSRLLVLPQSEHPGRSRSWAC